MRLLLLTFIAWIVQEYYSNKFIPVLRESVAKICRSGCTTAREARDRSAAKKRHLHADDDDLTEPLLSNGNGSKRKRPSRAESYRLLRRIHMIICAFVSLAVFVFFAILINKRWQGDPVEALAPLATPTTTAVPAVE